MAKAIQYEVSFALQGGAIVHVPLPHRELAE